jgi:hypothetical protein
MVQDIFLVATLHWLSEFLFLISYPSLQNIFTCRSSEDDHPTIPSFPPPKLPPFSYPKAEPTYFEVKFADRGHSFINVSVDYDAFSSPEDATLVRVKVYCATLDNFRRISGVSLKIKIPDKEVVSIYPKESTGGTEFCTEFSLTENDTSGFGLQKLGLTTPAGFGADIEAGGHRDKGTEMNHKGSMRSKSTVRGNILERRTVVQWSIKEAAANQRLGYGVNGEQEEMGFILAGKPEKFEYDCAITHVKDGKETVKQTMSRTWFQKYILRT